MALVFAMTTAVASVPTDAPVRRPLRTVAIGAAIGATGVVTTGIGAAWAVRNYSIPLVRFDDAAPAPFYTVPLATTVTGLGLVAVGAPVMAVGALRARSVLHDRSVPWWPGAVALGAAALAVPAVVGPGGVVTAGVLSVGAYALATTQWGMVRGAAGRATVGLVPTPGGLALCGGW
jgi:hypothetical protein